MVALVSARREAVRVCEGAVMEGIQQMFHELMGYDAYQQDLFI